ncbi:putative ubiquitin-protein ligase-like [Trypanosoma grayi]|uniref:putative ubiquitin-protein ligase-like n=1 Tax=Trypanosoma grayi TaxID=71804 RepID=UPI0004F40F6D|nr:putative ubiquitin-protein ligase-like [Trypanosoma grayi]KEG14099.1 putative ubiquitin-protein ligase-like [Trypanosoma grayi]
MSPMQFLVKQLPASPTELWTVVSACLVAGALLVLFFVSQHKRARRPAAATQMSTFSGHAAVTNSSNTETLQHGETKGQHHKEESGAVTSPAKKERGEKMPAKPTSVLGGYPEVDALILSPCQRYLFIYCRSKRRARLYPQNTNRAFMARGKELQEKYFVSVDEAVVQAMGGGGRVEVRAAAFSYDGTRLAVSERNSDTFLVFIIGNKCQLTLESSCKLPGHRLVSSLPSWGLAGAAYDLIVMMNDKDCEVEVFSLRRKEFLGKDKFRVGNALTWAMQDTTVAVAGSFLKAARLATVHVPPNGSGIQLRNSIHVQRDSQERVLALGLTTKNVPAFNTREYLVVFTEDGCGSVYDIESQTVNSKTERVMSLVGQFKDSTYEGWDPVRPMQMALSIYGGSHHEHLTVALSRDGDVAVYRQASAANASSKIFALEPVVVLHDCHEGDNVEQVVFVQNGEGLATSGGADGRHVRLWALPPLPS